MNSNLNKHINNKIIENNITYLNISLEEYNNRYLKGNEYFGIDLSSTIFGGWANVYRLFTDKTEVSIDNIDYLINIFTDKKTHYLRFASSSIRLLYGSVSALAGNIIGSVYGLGNLKNDSNVINEFKNINKDDNIWYHLVINYKKVNYDHIEVYKKLFDFNRRILSFVISEDGECKTIERRKASSNEISILKGFKASIPLQEYRDAYIYMVKKIKDEKKLKEWELFYDQVIKFYSTIIKHIETNIFINNKSVFKYIYEVLDNGGIVNIGPRV